VRGLRPVRCHDQVAHVEVIVRGLPPAARNAMHVDVEGSRRRRVEDEAVDARLLSRLAQGDGLGVLLAGLGVAARLQPAVQAPVPDEEDAGPVGRDDEGAAGDVAFGQVAIEGVRLRGHEGPDGLQVEGLETVGGHVPVERVSERHRRILAPSGGC